MGSFMKSFVNEIFKPNSIISPEFKAKFGKSCLNKEGRLEFAQLINNFRNRSKFVDETIFHKLTQTFALVLFEASMESDYVPCKILMNMAFTFYTKNFNLNLPQMDPIEFEIEGGDNEATIQYFHDIYEGSTEKKKENKFKQWLQRRSSTAIQEIEGVEDIETPNIKLYIFEVLQNQPIWRSMRFWNAAFHHAVNGERQHHQTSCENWDEMSKEEKDSIHKTEMQNTTFGVLVTFLFNMRNLGIGKQTCLQYLQRQATIAELGMEEYTLLKLQIDKPAS